MSIRKLIMTGFFTASIFTIGNIAIADELTIFEGYAGFEPLKIMDLTAALTELDGAEEDLFNAADLNNLCVFYVLKKEYSKAIENCSNAKKLASMDRGVAKGTLRDINSNLEIAQNRADTTSLAGAAD